MYPIQGGVHLSGLNTICLYLSDYIFSKILALNFLFYIQGSMNGQRGQI